MSNAKTESDPFDLSRFLLAQEGVYEQALSEIRGGRKQSHWMWFIFPQPEGLGFSPMAKKYAIRDMDEAEAYLEHPVLGERLRECVEAVLSIKGLTAHQIFGSPDDMKLHSCATLFAAVSPPESVFAELLERYFDGEPDEKTLELLG